LPEKQSNQQKYKAPQEFIKVCDESGFVEDDTKTRFVFFLSILLGCLWAAVGVTVALARNKDCPIWHFYTVGAGGVMRSCADCFRTSLPLVFLPFPSF